jgi:hypothetical protein
LVNAEHFRNNALFKLSHLPTTQCECVDFRDFAKQRNGGGGREKNLLSDNKEYQSLGYSPHLY